MPECKKTVATGARAFVAFRHERCFGIEDFMPARTAADGYIKIHGVTSESVINEITTLESAALNPERARRSRMQGTSGVGGDVNVELNNNSFLNLLAQAIGKYVAGVVGDSATPWTILPVASDGVASDGTLVANRLGTDSVPGANYDSAEINYTSGRGYGTGYYTVDPYGMEPGMTFIIGRDAGVIKDSAGNDPTNNLYFQYLGMKVNTWSLTATPGDIVTSTFSLLGREEVAGLDIAEPITDSGTNDPFTGMQGTATIDDVSVCLQAFSINLNNNLNTDQFCLGDDKRNSIPEGRREIDGSFTYEFTDLATYQKYLNGTSARIEVTFDLNSDGAETLKIILPKVEYNGATPVNAGPDAINVEVPYTALWDDDAGTGATNLLTRSGLAPAGFDIAIEIVSASEPY